MVNAQIEVSSEWKEFTITEDGNFSIRNNGGGVCYVALEKDLSKAIVLRDVLNIQASSGTLRL